MTSSNGASNGDPALLSTIGSSASQPPPSWPRPRTPVPPHRLAKLANALGISAPVPVVSQTTNDTQLYNFPSKSSTSETRRSPTPSLASTPQLITHSSASSFQSKFLLHIVPPLHIPHDSDSSETFELTPPPPSASGYHTQFNRGTLVPLLPTLQSQLWAIAKEYAFPSTTGMILYLVSSAPIPNPQTPLTTPDEPGPRLSEDIWKQLWTRVAKFEIETDSRVTTPNMAGLGFGYGGRSSPLFPQESTSSSNNALRPLISPGRATCSEPSHSDIDTPDTSVPSDSRATTLDLPGITSPSVIPILAKVEFDIDKQKAAWYGPWIRSRRLNHQKREHRGRARSESAAFSTTDDDSGGRSEVEAPKAAPLPLRLVDRQAIPRFLLSADEEEDDINDANYMRLSESPPGLENADPDGMANPPTAVDGDPLVDLFGTDGDNSADIHSDEADQQGHDLNPNTIEVPFDGRALSEPANIEDEIENDNDQENIRAVWVSRERPKLSLDISSPLDTMGRSSPTTAGTVTTGAFRKAAPPPLTLLPNTFDAFTHAETSPLLNTGDARLIYMGDELPVALEKGVNGGMAMEMRKSPSLSPSPTEDKRIGIFEDSDMGLEFEETETEEFDENDPNDRRRSFGPVLSASAPARIKTTRELDHAPTSVYLTGYWTDPGPTLSPSAPVGASGHGTPVQILKDHPDKPSGVWPAVPYSSLSRQEDEVDSPFGLDDFLAPPKLALNGVSNAIPVSPYKMSFSVSRDTESEESKARKRELDGHEPTYPDIVPPSLRKPASPNSPIIPLSPDPFGRFPSLPPSPPSASHSSPSLEVPPPQAKIKYSTFNIPPERHSSLGSLSRGDSITSHSDAASTAPSSRFSIDSTDEGKTNRTAASLNPVKNIKSLWRKNRKASVSSGAWSFPASQTGTGHTSPQPLPPTPSFPGPSAHRSLVTAPTDASHESVASLTPPPDRHPPKALYHDTPSLQTSQTLQQTHSISSINSMIFDQESPYPVHISSQRSSTSRPRTASQVTHTLSPTSSIHRHRSSVRDSRFLASLNQTDALPPPSPSTTMDMEKIGPPKSILKFWRSDSPNSPQLPEQNTQTRQSHADSVASDSTFIGGSRATPSSSFESARLLHASPPRRSNRGIAPSTNITG
ncbi:hypothetical protein B0F90DRAFT_1813420 [Multifurca ochricompacta]|uniref:Uncharacterized protein n=1 Tax=Multifurca ochricompacta TaxID=376703 RepID=A0AAD4MGC5_9AGAM|nr:hypothetical protein B0F90DRAFT_1813420 [Multifurca ochricompacta]